jgi:vacuolar protein sorting-associated protein 45
MCRRVGDLFSDKTVSSRLVSMARKSVKGVENVYTQHTPLLSTTLENVARGRLAHMDYPYIGGAETSPTAAKVVASLILKSAKPANPPPLFLLHRHSCSL